MNVSEFVEYLRSRNLSENTIRCYVKDVSLFNTFVQKPVQDITQDDVKKYLASLSDLKTSTVRRRLSCITTFLQWNKEQGIISETIVPKSKADFNLPKIIKRPIYTVSEDIFWKLCESIQRSEKVLKQRDQAIYCLIYLCGIRCSEIVNIDIDHVDMEKCTATIRHKGNPRKPQEKIDISHAMFSLRTYFESRQKNSSEPLSGPLFVNQDGSRIGERNIRRRLAADAKKVGLKLNPFHLFNSFALEFLRHNSIEELKTRLGYLSDSSVSKFVRKIKEEREHEKVGAF